MPAEAWPPGFPYTINAEGKVTRVSGGVSPLAHGYVSEEAAIESGEGFTVEKTGEGKYKITFTTPAANAKYSVFLTADGEKRLADVAGGSRTVNGFIVSTSELAVSQNRPFSFSVYA
jgi:lipocalin